jgi:hypothetical protein
MKLLGIIDGVPIYDYSDGEDEDDDFDYGEMPDIPKWLVILMITIGIGIVGYCLYGLICFIKLHESL